MEFLDLDVFLFFLFRNRNVIWKSINKTQCLHLRFFSVLSLMVPIIPASKVYLVIAYLR